MNTDNKLENKNENISDYDEKEKDTLDSSDEENSDKKEDSAEKDEKKKEFDFGPFGFGPFGFGPGIGDLYGRNGSNRGSYGHNGNNRDRYDRNRFDEDRYDNRRRYDDRDSGYDRRPDRDNRNGNDNGNGNGPGGPNGNGKKGGSRIGLLLFAAIITILMVYFMGSMYENATSEEIPYNKFLTMLQSGEVKSVELTGEGKIIITPHDNSSIDTTLPKKTYWTTAISIDNLHEELKEAAKNTNVEFKADVSDSESTIVDMSVEPPRILRPGCITQEMLEKSIGEVLTEIRLDTVVEEKTTKAPGLKYKHYAPKAEMQIVEGDTCAVCDTINKFTANWLEKGKKVGIIATEETKHCYDKGIVKTIGSREDDRTIARNLYAVLREFDEENVDVIYSESFFDF